MSSAWHRFALWMSKDSLLVRVMCVNAGLFLLGIAVLIVLSGAAADANDSAIYAVVVLLAGGGAYCIYTGLCFNKTVSRNDTIWLLDLWWLLLAMVLLAIPVTVLIRLFQSKDRSI